MYTTAPEDAMTTKDLAMMVTDDAMTEMDDEMAIIAATIFAVNVKMKNIHSVMTHTVNSFRISYPMTPNVCQMQLDKSGSFLNRSVKKIDFIYKIYI